MRIEELIIDIKKEIELTDFEDAEDVDDSVNYIHGLVYELDDDTTILNLCSILFDVVKYPSLRDSYFAMIDYLHKRS